MPTTDRFTIRSRVLAGSALLLFPLNALTQVVPTNEWVNFFSENSIFQCELLPVGTVIDAFDPQGVRCGTFTATIQGRFGFLAVYRDDPFTPAVDEGAEPGDLIRFEINGMEATPLNPAQAIWTQNGDILQLELEVPASPLPSISIDDVSVSEGDAGTVEAVFTVTLSAPCASEVTVEYATADGSATAGSDYVAISTTQLTFPPNTTTQTVTVVVNGDLIDEADETLLVNLTNPTNATITDAQGIGTIIDDDETRTLTVASSNPNSGVSIMVSPNDNNGQGNGTTQFTRTHNLNANVNLMAPSTVSGNHFKEWQRDGSFVASTVETSVIVDNDYTMTAVYETIPDVTLTWCAVALSSASGARDSVYVCLDGVTGLNIISYQLTVTFDEGVLNAVGATSVGTLSESFGPPTASTSVEGQITVGGFGTDPLSGSGQLVCLIFDVVGAPGATTNLCIQSVVFNAGNPNAVIPQPCYPYDLINAFDIAGSVTYCPSGSAVENTTLTLSGVASDSVFTDPNGDYLFADLTGNLNYVVTPSKIGEVGLFSVGCFDAALIARIAVGLTPATHCDSSASDVDENGLIQTFDAALTCRFAVGLPPFDATDKTGQWRFEPPARTYVLLAGAQSGQDFMASLLGDVDGNWQPASGSGVATVAKHSASQVAFVEEPLWSPDRTEVTIALQFGGEMPALSFELDLRFDPASLEFVQAESPLEGWNVIENDAHEGRLQLGMYSTTPLTERNEFVRIKWDVIQKVEPTIVSLELALVNGEPHSLVELEIAAPLAIPTEFALHQNYPNPFNPETTIRYDLPQPAKVQLVIYNLIGQEIRRLFDEEQEAGFHNITWDGKDKGGRLVASGVYVYRIQAGDFRAVRKLTLLR